MSFLFKTHDVDSQYKKVLNNQKDLIKNNKYMRELEEKYHKSTRRYTRSHIPKKKIEDLKTHDWPINSSLFTEILKKKLETVFIEKQPRELLSLSKPISRPRTRGNIVPSLRSKGTITSQCGIRSKNSVGEFSKINKIKIAKKPTSESPYSRLSVDYSLDGAYDEEAREMNVIRIPRYY